MQDGRIDGAIKVGNTWNIPIKANKPAVKRNIKLEKVNLYEDIKKDKLIMKIWIKINRKFE